MGGSKLRAVFGASLLLLLNRKDLVQKIQYLSPGKAAILVLNKD